MTNFIKEYVMLGLATIFLLLVTTQVQAAAASNGSMFARCAFWADSSALVEKSSMFKKAFFLLEKGDDSQALFFYSWGIGEGVVMGSGKSASLYYYSLCSSREMYAKDLIAQTKT